MDDKLDGLVYCDKCGAQMKLQDSIAVLMFAVEHPRVSKKVKLICIPCAELATEFLERA